MDRVSYDFLSIYRPHTGSQSESPCLKLALSELSLSTPGIVASTHQVTPLNMEELKGSNTYIDENVENIDGEEVLETKYACEFHSRRGLELLMD